VLVTLLQLLPLNDDLSSVGIPFEGVEYVVKPALTMGSTRWDQTSRKRAKFREGQLHNSDIWRNSFITH